MVRARPRIHDSLPSLGFRKEPGKGDFAVTRLLNPGIRAKIFWHRVSPKLIKPKIVIKAFDIIFSSCNLTLLSVQLFTIHFKTIIEVTPYIAYLRIAYWHS